MELEEAIKILNELKEEVALFSTGWKNKLKDDEKQAIETILKELKNSIPRKKIENKVKELEKYKGKMEKKNNYATDGKEKCKYGDLVMKSIHQINILQELLKD